MLLGQMLFGVSVGKAVRDLKSQGKVDFLINGAE